MPSFVNAFDALTQALNYIVKKLPWPAVANVRLQRGEFTTAISFLITTRVQFALEDIEVGMHIGPAAVREWLQQLVDRSLPPHMIDRRPHAYAFWCAHHEALVSAEHMNGCHFIHPRRADYYHRLPPRYSPGTYLIDPGSIGSAEPTLNGLMVRPEGFDFDVEPSPHPERERTPRTPPPQPPADETPSTTSAPAGSSSQPPSNEE